MKLQINANLCAKQLELYAGLARFAILRCGRGFGKTYLTCYYALRYAIEHPNSLVWYCANDISTLTELIIPMIERFAPAEIWVAKQKQQRIYTLFNGSKICFKTLESADNLRGRSIDLLVIEEAAFTKNLKQLWLDILEPQLSRPAPGHPLGRAIFVSSPNGSNYFRQLENLATSNILASKQRGIVAMWSVGTATVYDSAVWSPEEIERKRQSVPELTWLQEYMAKYVDEIGLVYWEMNQELCLVDGVKDQALYSIRGCDWGLADNTACAYISALPGQRAYIFDDYSAANLDAATQAKTILSRQPMPFRRSVLDSACWARDPALSSVAKRFAAAGLQCIPATKDFDGSQSDMKGLLAEGKILISKRCTTLIRALQSWQHGDHEPDILAAARYGINLLVKSGALVPPVRVAGPLTWDEQLKARRENAALANNTRQPNPHIGMQFRIYNGLRG